MMMDCKQFRELLDCYVDGELSADAAAAADAHLSECATCARTAAHLERLRTAVRQAVSAQIPSADLAQRIRQSLRPWWLPSAPFPAAGRRLAIAASLVLIIGVGLAVAAGARIPNAVAGAMDSAVARLAEPADVELEGQLVCRDCELEKRHGERPMCQRTGHRGAIATSDGRIWNIIEQPASAGLIHDPALLGKAVRVRARLFREAGSLAVQTFTIIG